jgi:hypothetical protein
MNATSRGRGGYKGYTKKINELKIRVTVAAIANRAREIKRLEKHLAKLKADRN